MIYHDCYFWKSKLKKHRTSAGRIFSVTTFITDQVGIDELSCIINLASNRTQIQLDLQKVASIALKEELDLVMVVWVASLKTENIES